MRQITILILLIFLSAGLISCAGTMKPMHTDQVRVGTKSESHSSLVSMPKPDEKVVVAVYRFRDQTGQYKTSERVSNWSTAVTQGATSILIKAVEDSGWFIPIEREGISNLLNERQIIQSIRQQHAGPEGPDPLPPLLFAGVMLEGGIIGYDTNVVTGGTGFRYLGIGGSSMYRKDQVTIYLRAVSTQSGRVLKTVHTTKSILSQQLEGGAFRYIDTNRLLEAEAGYTYNEPPVMAVTEAINEAVKQLILEGVDEGIWQPKDQKQITSYRKRFEEKREGDLKRDYFGFLEDNSLRSGWSFTPLFALGSYIGNYSNALYKEGFGLQIEKNITRYFSAKTNVLRTQLGAEGLFSNPMNSADLLLNVYATPDYSLSPFLGAGGGVIAFDKKYVFLSQQFFPAATFEAGLDYRINDFFGVRMSTNYRYLLTDGVDGISQGRYNDQQWNLNLGIVISPDLF